MSDIDLSTASIKVALRNIETGEVVDPDVKFTLAGPTWRWLVAYEDRVVRDWRWLWLRKRVVSDLVMSQEIDAPGDGVDTQDEGAISLPPCSGTPPGHS